MSKADILRAAPIALILMLGGCDDRLDGRNQPNPFAEDDARAAAEQSRPAQTVAPQMTSDREAAESSESDEFAEGFEPEEEFDDGPFDPSGYDPAPMDDASGFDPSPVDLDGGYAEDVAGETG